MCDVYVICLPRRYGKTSKLEYIARSEKQKNNECQVVYVAPSQRDVRNFDNAIGFDLTNMSDITPGGRVLVLLDDPDRLNDEQLVLPKHLESNPKCWIVFAQSGQDIETTKNRLKFL